jgi:hypothetical protein
MRIYHPFRRNSRNRFQPQGAALATAPAVKESKPVVPAGNARPPGSRPYRRRPRRKHRRLASAALFSAVRGAAYTLGVAIGGWGIYWIADRW